MNIFNIIVIIGLLAFFIGLTLMFPPESRLPEQNQHSRDNHNMIQVHGNYIINQNENNKFPISRNKDLIKIKKDMSDEIDGWGILNDDLYTVKIDRKIYKIESPSFFIYSKKPESQSKKGGLYQYFLAKKYRDNKVRISGYLKIKRANYIQIGLQAGGGSRKWII